MKNEKQERYKRESKLKIEKMFDFYIDEQKFVLYSINRT